MNFTMRHIVKETLELINWADIRNKVLMEEVFPCFVRIVGSKTPGV